MERIDIDNLYATVWNSDVTFYSSNKTPLWSGFITETWSVDGYVSATNVQTWNKDGSPRKNSVKSHYKKKLHSTQLYSFGLTPEGVEPKPKTKNKELTQEQVEAKLKEYVTDRLNELTYYRDNPELHLGKSNVEDWHIAEAIVTIFRELTE